MDFFKKPIMRVPTWTFLCGFATTVLQMLILPQLFGRAYADHIDLFASLFNGLAVVLFFVIGFFVMHKLPYKTLFASAAIGVAISLVVIVLEQITGASPLLVFLFFLYPFLYSRLPTWGSNGKLPRRAVSWKSTRSKTSSPPQAWRKPPMPSGQ